MQRKIQSSILQNFNLVFFSNLELLIELFFDFILLRCSARMTMDQPLLEFLLYFYSHYMQTSFQLPFIIQMKQLCLNEIQIHQIAYIIWKFFNFPLLLVFLTYFAYTINIFSLAHPTSLLNIQQIYFVQYNI
ncbi:hypothetical protein pb186bvf_013435 [Paramecium bursaria]